MSEVCLAKKVLRIVPLGGLGEIGKNMTAIEYGRDIIVIDCGVMFPDPEHLGVDLIIPDYTWVVENRERVRAILVTHGHEDHIGGLPFLLAEVDAPVYATPLTRGLIEVKLKETGLLKRVKLQTIRPREKFNVGPFTVEPFHVNHSIPDAVGFAIDTPAGLIVHTGERKMTLEWAQLKDYKGERAQRGAVLPRGWRGVTRLETYVEPPTEAK